MPILLWYFPHIICCGVCDLILTHSVTGRQHSPEHGAPAVGGCQMAAGVALD
jgi:hypothetical protein